MDNAWTNAVVVDPRELQRLADESAGLHRLRSRHRRMQYAFAAIAAVALTVFSWQATRLSAQAGEVQRYSDEVRRYRKLSRRADVALDALARSHDQILAATEQAPSVGTKSWGRRFTITKYLARSAAYGKDNDGFTSTMMKADPEARIIAVDPKLIPYGSWVWIEGLGWYQAQDCGSAIKGFRLDVMTDTENDAMQFGKQDRFVIVVPLEKSVG